MKSISLLALASALLMAGPALAADLIVESAAAAPVAAAYDWSGFYAGVHAGFGTGTLHLGAPVDPADADEDADGFLGGIQAGYNFQSGNLVFGVQTDLSASGIAYDEDAVGDDTVDWLGSTTGRVGVALDSVLPYIKAGIAYGGATGDYDGTKDSNTHVGWTAGAGVELALADNVSVFGEYDYVSLGEESYSFAPVMNIPIPVSIELHTVRAGLNFSF